MKAVARNSLVAACAITSVAMVLAACSSGGGSTTSGGSGTSSGGTTGSAKTITVDGIAFPKPEKTSLTMGVSSIDVVGLPNHLFTLEGIAKKFGITLTEKDFAGDGPTTQALVAGQVDVIDASGGAAVLTQVTNVPAEVIYVNTDTVSDVLFTQKSISSAADLKGKSVAVSSIGGYSYAEAVLALRHLGLTTKDVTLQAVGNDSSRLAALTAGSVGAAIQDDTEIPMLTAQGYHALVNLGTVNPVPGHYVGDCIIVPVSFAKQFPNTTLDLAAMEQLAQATFHDINSVATNSKYWAEVSGEPLSQATSDIKDTLKAPWHPSTGQCNTTTEKFTQSIVATANPAVAKIDPQKWCTSEFTNKLIQMGFTKALKIPTN